MFKNHVLSFNDRNGFFFDEFKDEFNFYCISRNYTLMLMYNIEITVIPFNLTDTICKSIQRKFRTFGVS